jgi:CRP-like cAMP-binding protein
MHRKTSQNEDAKNKTFQLLEEAEKKRASIRFEHGLEELRSGKGEILKNAEFTGRLSSFLYEGYAGKDRNRTVLCLGILFNFLNSGKYADFVLPVLDRICENSLKTNDIKLMQLLCSQYVSAFERKESGCPISTEMCGFFVKACTIFARNGLWYDFDYLISALWKLRGAVHPIEKETAVSLTNIFADIATDDVMAGIMQQRVTGDQGHKKHAAEHIKYLGDKAVLFLLNRLVFSDTTQNERLLLIELIAGFGEDMVETLRLFMEEDLPWYTVRNLVGLIGEIGNPDLYQMIEGYLIHPDARVQQQVVGGIVKLGGENVEKRLIQALPVVEDKVKLKMIMQMSAYKSLEIADCLMDMVQKRHAFSKEMQEKLLYTICITLRSYPFPKVVKLLRHLLHEIPKSSNDKLCVAIEETISRIEPAIRHRVKGEAAEAELPGYDSDPVEGEKESANSDDFPDELREVILAAEIMEEEKGMPTSAVRVEIWDELSGNFSKREYNRLLSGLLNEHYAKDEKIVSSGEIDPCLYFIGRGGVRLSCKCGHNEIFLKRLNPGDVIGVGPFFSASVWTVTMTALQDTRMQVLRRDLFMKAVQGYPEIEMKLLAFCRNRDMVHELVKMSGRDRRDSARYAVTMPVTVYNILLDPYGGEGKRTFEGEMLDISRGGMSFSIHLSKKENVHLLLGRQIISELRTKGNEVLECLGLVVGVHCQQELVKDFSVHVKFYSELEQYQITNVLNPQANM